MLGTDARVHYYCDTIELDMWATCFLALQARSRSKDRSQWSQESPESSIFGSDPYGDDKSEAFTLFIDCTLCVVTSVVLWSSMHACPSYLIVCWILCMPSFAQ
jgi:hypothetical protein